MLGWKSLPADPLPLHRHPENAPSLLPHFHLHLQPPSRKSFPVAQQLARQSLPQILQPLLNLQRQVPAALPASPRAWALPAALDPQLLTGVTAASTEARASQI